jgi:hypothetical protein
MLNLERFAPKDINTDKPTTTIEYRKIAEAVQPLIRKPGNCHPAQRIPSNIADHPGAIIVCIRGSANPRHPGSSINA